METNALRTLWTECFGNEDNWIDTFFRTALVPDHVCVRNRQGRLAAALCWMDVSCRGQKLAYLYAIATAPDWRGQGLCRELMASACETLTRQHYAGCIVVPAEDGLRQMYRKMGFENFGGIGKLSVQRGEPVPIRRISPEEYARLRRSYLPKDGVVQESGAETYLAAGADLYAGENFLLAAEREGQTLFGLELLGNSRAAEGILGGLNYEAGTFRVPGSKPFAMFRPLIPGTPPPGYFGLAFE